jgi:HD-GYP domain-containing protein (c-di-GMP phosphodiesterase class II)
MLKKVATSQITIGMYIHSVEGSWLGHSLWKTRFVIKDEETLKRVRACGAAELWIDVAQGVDIGAPAPAQASTAAAVAQAPAAKPTTSVADELRTANKILERSKETVTSLFTDARMGNAVDTRECSALVDQVVASVGRHSDALVSLCRLKTADEYTYMHSVAVCALMVSLGRQLGLDEAACHGAGMAGLLHDIGKSVMPMEVLNKPGKLTDAEFEIMKSHAARGHAILLAGGIDSADTLDVCRHHHERIDGKGYPDGLSGDQISLVARMGAVCDVYDAITSNRPYKAGWDPAESVARMVSWEGHFDTVVLQTFIKTLGIYPVGSLVRMESGKLGVVLEQNRHKLTAPRVKLFFSTKTNLPFAPVTVDLADRQTQDKIVAREPREKWSFPYLDDLWTDQVT